MLEEISFICYPYASGWEIGLKALLAFHEEYGHYAIPVAYHDQSGFKLGSWVYIQRKTYKAGKLAAERIKALNDASFAWTL